MRLRRPAAIVGLLALASYVALTSVLVVVGLLMTHLGVHGGIGHWDDHVSSWFVRHRDQQWTRWSGNATTVANTLSIILIAVAVTVFAFVKRWGRQALLIPLGLVVEIASFLTTNYAVRRPRPAVGHVGSTPSTFSWPSGHVAATLVLYGGIALLVMAHTRRLIPRLVAWCLAGGLTTAVAVSRIYRGDHHPTDTFAGVVLGIGALTAAVLAMKVSEPTPGERAVSTAARVTTVSGKATVDDPVARPAAVG